MGTFDDTANVDYRLSFADQGKQTSVFRFRIAQTKESFPFSVSSVFLYIYTLYTENGTIELYIYVYIIYTYTYAYTCIHTHMHIHVYIYI